MKTKTIEFKARIAGSVAEARALKHEALKHTGPERAALKNSAKENRPWRRSAHLAYAFLRGIPPAAVEALGTTKLVNVDQAVSLAMTYYTQPPKAEDASWAEFYAQGRQHKADFEAAFRAALGAWNKAITEGRTARLVYEAQVAHLHKLRDRHGDAPCVDRLLDRMDITWLALTDEDRAVLNDHKAVA